MKEENSTTFKKKKKTVTQLQAKLFTYLIYMFSNHMFLHNINKNIYPQINIHINY